MLKRRGTEEEQRVGWMERARCFRAVVEMPVTVARMRRIVGLLQRRGAEEERRIGQSPESPLGTDAHMRRARGVLQQRGAEGKRRVGWMEGTRCQQAVARTPVLHRR